MKIDTERRDWCINTTTARAALIIEALGVAQNSYEYDGEQLKADSIALLIADIKGEL